MSTESSQTEPVLLHVACKFKILITTSYSYHLPPTAFHVLRPVAHDCMIFILNIICSSSHNSPSMRRRTYYTAGTA
jgi:hypothetical protein